MMFGKVLRPTGFNATLVSVDTSAAEKMPGVKVVHDGDFIGVVAPDAWTAEQALAAIKAKWTVPLQPSNKNIFDYLKNNPEAARGNRPQPATAGSRTVFRCTVDLAQSYTVQYIAHAPLEPRAAVAKWENGKLTVWTGTQRPFGVRDELVAAFHLDSAQVRVIQPDMGSGYGGKHTGEAAVEAARLSKAAGTPVKVVWTREEEFTWAYLRPAGLMELKASVQTRRHSRRLGAPQLQLRPLRPPHAVSRRQSGHAIPRIEVAACARGPIADSPPPRTTSPASPSWTSWPTRSRWTRSHSA